MILDRASIANLPGAGNVSAMLGSLPTPLPAGTSNLMWNAGPCSNAFSPIDGGAPLPTYLALSGGCIGLGQFGTSVGAAYPAMVEANDVAGNLLGYAFAKNGALTNVTAGSAPTVVDAGETMLQVPALPAADSAWAPIAGSLFGFSTVYAIQGGTGLPTYAALRAAASLFTLQTACIYYPMIPPLPAARTVMASGYTTGSCG